MREHVEHIMASRRFARSHNMKRLLGYLTEKTLAGSDDALKPLAIGREALGRGVGFDPQLDPIVRVEAARLRRLLAEYAADEGAGEGVLASLPLGGYAMAFEMRAAPPDLCPSPIAEPVAEVQPAAEIARAAPGRRPPRLALAAALLSVLVAVFGWSSLEPQPLVQKGEAGTVLSIMREFLPRHDAPRADIPMVHVARFEAQTADAESEALARDAEHRLRDALARFDGIAVLAASAPAALADPLRSASGLPRPWRADGLPPTTQPDYVIEGSIGRDRFGRHVFSGRLIDARRGLIVASRLVEEPHHTAPELSPDWVGDVIRDVASRVASPYGVIQTREWKLNSAVDPSVTATPAICWFTRSGVCSTVWRRTGPFCAFARRCRGTLATERAWRSWPTWRPWPTASGAPSPKRSPVSNGRSDMQRRRWR